MEASEVVAPVPTLDQTVGQTSETDVQDTSVQSDSADTVETVAETDEQKNAREVAERQERSEKRARGVEKRLAELTADKYDARSRADAAERRAQEAERRLQEREAAQPKPQNNGAPSRDDFTDYEKYLEAKTEWIADRKADARIAEREQKFVEQQRVTRSNEAAAALQREVQQKLAAYEKDHPDMRDVISSHDETVPEYAAFAVMRHKDTAPLMEFLGRNPEFVVSLQKMDQVEQGLAIGELAATLRKQPPQVSKAPAPGVPVGPRGSTNKDVRAMTADEYYDHITNGRGRKK